MAFVEYLVLVIFSSMCMIIGLFYDRTDYNMFHILTIVVISFTTTWIVQSYMKNKSNEFHNEYREFVALLFLNVLAVVSMLLGRFIGLCIGY